MTADVEKADRDLQTQHQPDSGLRLPSFLSKLSLSKNVEARGIVPVPKEERNNRRTYSIVCCVVSQSLSDFIPLTTWTVYIMVHFEHQFTAVSL